LDGDQFTGTVKVRLGPIGLTYKGKASFVEKDEAAHRVVLDAQGRDARGNGTASAKVTATLAAEGDRSTRVEVLTDLNITGRPAQFGRGVMVDVGNKLIDQFADCLAGKLAGIDAAPLPEDEAAPSGPTVAPAEVASAAAEPGVVSVAAEQPAVAAPGVTPTADPAAMVGGSGPGPAAVEAVPDAELAEVSPMDQPSPAAAEIAAGVQATADSSAPGTDPVAPTFTEPAATSEPASSGSARPITSEVEPIDLLGSAGPALAKRLAPIAAVALAVVLLIILRRRR
jgi:carbon monoxide dehydrogenase subunit G